MLRPVITATALIALAGSSLAYAQHNFDGGRGFANDEPRFEQRHRLSVADASAFADARIAALKAGLPAHVRPGQELAAVRAGRSGSRPIAHPAAAGAPRWRSAAARHAFRAAVAARRQHGQDQRRSEEDR